MKIYQAYDLDYLEDYDYLQGIFDTIGDTPATFFLVGNRHPDSAVSFPETCEIGNHSFMHEPDWYETTLDFRISDLEKNDKWLNEKYGKKPKVYRSPHLRNFKDTADEMEKLGYKREMECAECPWCPPMHHSHLKVYFSSHHHFGSNPCHRKFEEAFELICQKGKDFTFFLDPRHFNSTERLQSLKNIIKIGNDYGKWDYLSNN